MAAPTFPSRWRVGRQLGAGGQAAVWLALDTELKENVAIKVLRADLAPEARERLKREVSIGRNLPHPNLARVYELLDLGDRVALVMEYLPGGSLAERLAAGEVAIADAVRWVDQALAALAHLHGHGVVHRDVKPSNLLLDEAGTVKLADLGLAKRMADGRDLTRTSTSVGTPMYMSPEQVRGDEAAPASDLYALGVSLYQLLTGRPPYLASSEFEVARMHLQEAPPDPRRLRPDCPAWLGRFVLRLLEKRPGDRYRDAHAALTALRRQQGSVSPSHRRRAALAAAVTAAAVLLGLGTATVVRARAEAARVVRVEAADTVVRGLDARGREAWRVVLDSRVEQVEHADLDGDGVPELVAATQPLSIARGAPVKSEVLVVTRAGRVLTRVSPEDVVDAWDYEFPKLLTPTVTVADLDSAAPPELLVRCNQRAFYPSALLVYWPAADLWRTVAFHSGWLRQVVVAQSDTGTTVKVAAVNNRLGMLPVVGELACEPPRTAREARIQLPTSSPEVGMSEGQPGGWVWYTPLAEDLVPMTVSLAADGALAMTTSSGTAFRVDALGNPDPGPNAGSDLRRERRRFFSRLGGDFAPIWQPSGAGEIRAAIAATRAESEALMREAPYRAVLGLYGGRALARAGDLAGAADLLEETRSAVPYEDISYRLAHLRALEGRTGDAAALLRAVIGSRKTSRGQYDAVHLLLRIGIETRDPALVQNALTRFTLWRPDSDRSADTTGVVVALAARAHVWWGEVTGADAVALSWTYAPDGAAMAAIARWRLGRASEADLAAVREAIAANPEARWEGELALAAVELGLGRAGDAVTRAGAAIQALEPLSRDDFSIRQVLDLARGLFVRALADSGQRAEAAREAKATRPLLRDGLLPAILVDEAMTAMRRNGSAR